MLKSLAVSVLGNISRLASSLSGSYFLQEMVKILATRHPACEALHILIDEMIQDLAQLASTEPGSRLVQEVLANCQEPHLFLSIIRWLEENLEHIIVSKPAVFLAL